MSSDRQLIVEFMDERWLLEQGEQITFGRAATIELDSNQSLHRTVGRLFDLNGLWWLRNEGSVLDIQLGDRDSRSSLLLTPNHSCPIGFRRSVLRVTAGRSRYELLLEASLPEIEPLDPEDDAPVTVTQHGRAGLTASERQVLATLARSRLLDPHGKAELPTNAAVAHELGLSMTTLNRKLDRLCAKFARAGVTGLKGDSGKLATNRRERLVDHCLKVGILTLGDLDAVDR